MLGQDSGVKFAALRLTHEAPVYACSGALFFGLDHYQQYTPGFDQVV